MRDFSSNKKKKTTLSEDQIDAFFEKYKAVVVEKFPAAKRRLAYAINKRMEVVDMRFKIDIDPNDLVKLKEVLLYMDDVLRLSVRRDQDQISSHFLA